ncbi:MAG: hypothetical protein Q9M91_08580 [Candidatus Dojkabacteria bacterium]|nr:hypothetical protein [Candidatus Dojkabacteria bacterium]
MDIYQNEKSKLESAKSGIEAFISDIDEYARNHYKNSNIKVYEGKQGYKLFMDSRLKVKDKVLYEIGNRKFVQEFVPKGKEYDSYIADYISRRVKLGISLKYMTDNSEAIDKFDTTSSNNLKEVRALKGNYKFSTLISFLIRT